MSLSVSFPATAADDSQARRVLDVHWIVTGVAAIVLLASIATLLTFEYGRDQGIYAVVAREFLKGGVPYRDAFDFKPPGIFVVYAIARALLGASVWGIRLLEATAMLTMVGGLVFITRHTLASWRLGFVAGAFAVFLHVGRGPWHTGQPESFGAAMTVWGLALALLAWDTGGRRGATLWFLSGVLFGCCGLMKPQLAGVGGTVALLAAVASWVSRSGLPKSVVFRRGLSLIAATALGTLLPIACTALWFQWRGGLRELYQVLFVFTPKYTLLSWQTGTLWDKVLRGINEWIQWFSPLIGLGAALLLALKPRGQELRLFVVFMAAIALHVAGIVLQSKFFPYHWGATHPLSALIAALGTAKLFQQLSGRSRSLRAFAALCVVGLAVLGVRPNELRFFDLGLRTCLGSRPEQASIDGSFSPRDFAPESNRRASQVLAQLTPPNEPVFIWGFEPIIYDAADRPLGSRYIYNVPQRASWSSTAARAELMEDLRRTRPGAILVQHQDEFAYVTGNSLDSAQTLAVFPELAELLRRDYRSVAPAGHFDVYQREAAR